MSEAFIGAVFVELGFDAARTWFVSAWNNTSTS
jgi:dsRNA-specific ribonuclease